MRSVMRRAALYPLLLWLGTASGVAQAPPGQPAPQPLTWQNVRDRFEASNPTLLADKLNIDESRAQEISAYLRPNPTFILTTDGTQLRPYQGVWQPLRGTSI